ncbi:MAG TPA: ABC transporter ATP-binding protein, partial [Gammaproteobacteria bacterium]|nr:ABC transporter ATP-binding protein [Gammaproteobacteria bacterium]
VADELHDRPGVEQTVAFGSALHVSGTDAEALRSTLDALTRERALRIEPIHTGLEDAFIHLMKRGSASDAPKGWGR